MHLRHLRARLDNLVQRGFEVRIGPPASCEEINAAELRLNVTFPDQVRWFYETLNGLEVVAPPFRVFSLPEVERQNHSLAFCLCNGVHPLAFDITHINSAGQWSIIAADTGHQVTFTMASFWSIRMWSWIDKQRPIWYDFHSEPGSN